MHEHEPPVGERPKAEPSPASLQVARLRRIDALAVEERERDRVRPWDGAEHAGTVVAAREDGVIVHVGRGEHVHVPSRDGDDRSQDLVGRHVSVDRAGNVRETPPNERAGADLGPQSYERGPR